MKNLFYKIAMAFMVVVLFTGCERDLINEIAGEVTPPSVKIDIVDASGNAISGAVVDIYNTLDGYISESGAIASATSDASGSVVFDAAAFNNERGNYYFNVASGILRNWTSVTSTGFLLMNDGQTSLTTTLAEVPSEFIAMTANTWLNSEYYYGATQANPPCEADDVLTFLKDGTVLRAEGATACASVSSFQSPISATGVVWSKWTVGPDPDNAGSNLLTIRDLDPGFDGSSCNHESAETGDCYGTQVIFNANGTVTLDYSGGGGSGTYRAVLTPN